MLGLSYLVELFNPILLETNDFNRQSILLDKAPGFEMKGGNALFTLNRTTHSNKKLLCVVRFNVNRR